MPEQILSVPYYRQHDMDSELNSYWQNRSCSILALKMVIDYYRQKDEKPPVDLSKLFEKAMKNGGVDANGSWYQAAIVKTAQDYGYRAWRRSWQPSQRDIDFFKSEGLNSASSAAWQSQVRAEALPTLFGHLRQGIPIIASVAKEFEQVDRAHLIVLTGAKFDKGQGLAGFYYNDPYSKNEKPQKDRFVKLDKFISKWLWRGIFVVPERK